jgi:AcrR family transcriptional regulator
MTGLRERQKEDRRSRIIAAARGLFAHSGLDNITIEAIAGIAGVSSVTVHNYYGTKSGVLLALVAESDSELLDTLARSFEGRARDLTDLVLRFSKIVCEHAVTRLDKAIWRQVIAASVGGADPRFGKSYQMLDLKLAEVLIREIESLQSAGKAPPLVSASDLGKALFNVQNTRFVQFISSDKMTKAEAANLLRKDLLALFAIGQG